MKRPGTRAQVPAEVTSPEAVAEVGSGPGDDVTESPSTGFRLRDMSRRGFLRTGSVGVIAVGAVGSIPGLSGLLTSAEADAPEVAPAASGTAAAVAPAAESDTSGLSQAAVHVTDMSTGEMRIFFGNQTITVQNPDLARSIGQAVQAGR